MRAKTEIVALAVALLAGVCAAARPCRIAVVDEENGWPVPLVELRTVNGLRFVSDNAGVIAVDEPDLMNRRVWFGVEGHGYGVEPDASGQRSVTLGIRPGGSLKVSVQRHQLAKRLGRIGGVGLFAESRKLGEHLDKSDQGEAGRDSVQVRPYKGRLFWLWGDTNMQDLPIGIFNTTAATTPLPPFRKLEPPIYPPYTQYCDGQGRVRGTIKIKGPGPCWLFGLIDLRDKDGKEHLCSTWGKVPAEREKQRNGLCEWNDKTEMFEEILVLNDVQAGIKSAFFPDASPCRWTDEAGRKWLLYGAPFPHHRIPDSYEAWKAPSTWEEIDWTGREKVLKVRNGEKFGLARGMMIWNTAIRKWVCVYGRQLGFGDLWYAEADSPFGPWTNGQRIVWHKDYTFYNSVIHGEYADKPYLVVEATYTDAYTGNPNPTPRYNYTQMLYRLDLMDKAVR